MATTAGGLGGVVSIIELVERVFQRPGYIELHRLHGSAMRAIGNSLPHCNHGWMLRIVEDFIHDFPGTRVS